MLWALYLLPCCILVVAVKTRDLLSSAPRWAGRGEKDETFLLSRIPRPTWARTGWPRRRLVRPVEMGLIPSVPSTNKTTGKDRMKGEL